MAVKAEFTAAAIHKNAKANITSICHAPPAVMPQPPIPKLLLSHPAPQFSNPMVCMHMHHLTHTCTYKHECMCMHTCTGKQ